MPPANSSPEKKALTLFHDAATRVPAYKDFLKRTHVNPARIKTIQDFALVPPTDAKNYTAAYSIEKRSWNGNLAVSAQLIAMSSGTSGEPKFWPRGADQDQEAATVHEWLYKNYFQVDRHSTLLLIGFPMGVYVSGIATVLPSWITARKNPGMTVVNVGNNKVEMLRVIRKLSGAYEQTILIGHPFFIKDVVETGAEEGIPWTSKNLGMMFCSEGFTEDWREYLRKKARIPEGSVRIFNTYGSSEMLLMAYETPLSIKLKKKFEQDAGVLLPPQVFQYNPMLRYIESVDKELIFTSASGIPMIRYNLKDSGEVFSFRQGVAMFGMHPGKAWRMPFVTLSQRSDRTMIFYAANIYPEHIRAGLSHATFFKNLTGKFTMRKEYLKNMDEFLEINIELKPDIKPTQALAKNIRNQVVQQLEKINLEYKFLRKNLDKDIIPRIKLLRYGDEKYFKQGLKPRYIAKN